MTKIFPVAQWRIPQQDILSYRLLLHPMFSKIAHNTVIEMHSCMHAWFLILPPSFSRCFVFVCQIEHLVNPKVYLAQARFSYQVICFLTEFCRAVSLCPFFSLASRSAKLVGTQWVFCLLASGSVPHRHFEFSLAHRVKALCPLDSDATTQKAPTVRCSEFELTFTLPLGCSSSVTDTLSCCSRLFTSLEQHTLTAPCTCDVLYSENVLLSMTSKRPVPLWMRLARRLMSIALRLVGPFSPAML